MTAERHALEETILVVDDNVTNLKVIVEYLEGAGFETMTARDGQDALEKAQRGQPDLILLDVMMPAMDGFETCRRLKADGRTQAIPVLFMTALTNVEDKLKGFSAGGVDYITKPFQAEEVVARVKTHLALRSLQKELQKSNVQLAAANRQITALNERLYTLFRQFAAKEVADELLAQGFSLGGKYVEATAMFADIRSFTKISESLPPDLTIELLNDYYAYVIDAITSEGGIVNQIAGDGIMCIFGAPVRQEDHPQRAVRAALRMIERLGQFNQEQAAKGRVQIRIGIGIAMGRGIAGYIGTQTRTSYTWVSNATNLAARLDACTKQVGKPILIDENVRQALGDSIQVEDEGFVDIEGIAQPVHVFSVPLGQELQQHPNSVGPA